MITPLQQFEWLEKRLSGSTPGEWTAREFVGEAGVALGVFDIVAGSVVVARNVRYDDAQFMLNAHENFPGLLKALREASSALDATVAAPRASTGCHHSRGYEHDCPACVDAAIAKGDPMTLAGMLRASIESLRLADENTRGYWDRNGQLSREVKELREQLATEKESHAKTKAHAASKLAEARLTEALEISDRERKRLDGRAQELEREIEDLKARLEDATENHRLEARARIALVMSAAETEREMRFDIDNLRRANDAWAANRRMFPQQPQLQTVDLDAPTLRDRFAMAALDSDLEWKDTDGLAKSVYEIADAMLIERAKVKP